MSVLRAAAPVVSAYALFAGMVVYALRHPARLPSGGGWGRLARHLGATVAGGYAVFLVIVLVFHTWIGGEAGAMASAVTRGGLLVLACAGAFVLTSWAVAAVRRGMHPC